MNILKTIFTLSLLAGTSPSWAKIDKSYCMMLKGDVVRFDQDYMLTRPLDAPSIFTPKTTIDTTYKGETVTCSIWDSNHTEYTPLHQNSEWTVENVSRNQLFLHGGLVLTCISTTIESSSNILMNQNLLKKVFNLSVIKDSCN